MFFLSLSFPGLLVLLAVQLGLNMLRRMRRYRGSLTENQEREQRWVKALAEEADGVLSNQRDNPRDALFMGRTGVASVIAANDASGSLAVGGGCATSGNAGCDGGSFRG